MRICPVRGRRDSNGAQPRMDFAGGGGGDVIDRVLWTESEIADRVSDLAGRISLDFSGASPGSVVLVGVATGAFLFLADLARCVHLPLVVDFVRVGSYWSGTESNSAPSITCDVKTDIRGKHVVLVLSAKFPISKHSICRVFFLLFEVNHYML